VQYSPEYPSVHVHCFRGGNGRGKGGGKGGGNGGGGGGEYASSVTPVDDELRNVTSWFVLF